MKRFEIDATLCSFCDKKAVGHVVVENFKVTFCKDHRAAVLREFADSEGAE